MITAVVDEEGNQGGVPVVNMEHVREPVQAVAQLPGCAHSSLGEEDVARDVPLDGGIEEVPAGKVGPSTQEVDRHPFILGVGDVHVGRSGTAWQLEAEEGLDAVAIPADEAVLRDHHPRINALLAQHFGQSADDIPQAARLSEWCCFCGDKQHVHRHHSPQGRSSTGRSWQRQRAGLRT